MPSDVTTKVGAGSPGITKREVSAPKLMRVLPPVPKSGFSIPAESKLRSSSGSRFGWKERFRQKLVRRRSRPSDSDPSDSDFEPRVERPNRDKNNMACTSKANRSAVEIRH